MKLRSLFLASIAALAMASCSNNEDEIIDNGSINAEKNAFMQFGFSYANSGTDTRATQDEQLPEEQTFQSALLVVAYNGGGVNTFVKSISRDEFTPIFTDQDPATGGKYYQSLPFEVTAGNVNAYVIMNPTAAIKTALDAHNNKAVTPAQVEATLKALNIDDIAVASTDNNFIMYGETLGKTLVDKQTTAVTVAVDRITAKMRERTAQTSFPDIDATATGGTLTSKVTINLTNYAFTNLNDETNLVYQADAPVKSFITGSVYDGKTVNNGYTFYTMGAPSVETQITYCFENENAETTAGLGDNITSIIYKANIVAKDLNDTPATAKKNLFIYNNTVYDFAGLQTAYGAGLTLKESATIADFAKLTIRKYEEGVCYYRKAINSYEGSGSARVGTNVIKRNNLYLLEVSSVSKIGFPEPIPFDDPTMMRLNIEVMPWTFNENAFDL